MNELARRLERIEQIVTDADCVCARHPYGLVVIDDGWSDAQKKHAEDGAAFGCPAHGTRMPPSLNRLSPSDAAG